MQFSEFGTRDLPALDQLEAWKAWYGRVFDTSPLHQDDDGFFAHARSWTLPGFALNQVTVPGLSVVRTKTLIRREPVDHWAITHSRRSMTWLDSSTASLAAPAGLPFVLSLGQTMENRREADDRIQLYLSHDSFRGIAPLLDACCMTSLEPSGARLLTDYMRLLLRKPAEPGQRGGNAAGRSDTRHGRGLHRHALAADHPARPPLAHLMAAPEVSDSLSHGSGRHHFFVSRSFNAALSRCASARSF